MRTRVKICCICSPAEAKTAIALGADAIGLVGPMPSGPGVIADAEIAAIAAQTPPPVASFLLTAQTAADAIAAHLDRTRASTAQMVSPVPAQELARLAALRPGARRVQVVHVEDDGALDHIAARAAHVHAFLLDSGRPSAATPELGGTGRVHDWSVSARFVAASPKPVFLAGGLNADNVGAAIAAARPFGVDVCSGVRADGALDPDRLAAFMAAARAADSAL